MKTLSTLSATAIVAAVALFTPNLQATAYGPPSQTTLTQGDSEQRECLALNIYHESKGESELGQRAVAYVTLNRVLDKRYPDNICSVVQQSVRDADGTPKRNKCQFSWYCDGKSDEPTNEEAYAQAKFVASVVINTYGYSFDPTMGATMYHADSVKPYWRKAFTKTTKIENHIFYR